MKTFLRNPINIHASSSSTTNRNNENKYISPRSKTLFKSESHQIKIDLATKSQIVEEYCYLKSDTTTCKEYFKLLNDICNKLDNDETYMKIITEYDVYKIEHNKMLKVFSKLHILLDYYNMNEPNTKDCENLKNYYNKFYNDITNLFH